MSTIKPTQNRDYICDFRQPETGTFVPMIEHVLLPLLAGIVNVEDTPATPVPVGRARVTVIDCTDEQDDLIMALPGVERAAFPEV